MPDLSVVICTVNRADLIAAAVGSVLAADAAGRNIEVVVVDQSPDAATRLALAGLVAADARLRYVHTPRPGLSRAYNIGIRETSAPLLAFTDDDCLVPEDWLTSIAAAFARYPDAALLYGQVIAAPELKGGPGVVPELAFDAPRKLSRATGFRVYGMGANFAARRSLFASIGAFDEVLGGGGPLRSSQDFDFQFRVYRAGLVCLIEPSVKVIHYGLREAARWPDTLRAYGIGDGGFYVKHIRCGDLLATRLFAGRVARQTACAVVRPLLRRKRSNAYLRGMLAGMRDSFAFPVDRRSRLYVQSAVAEEIR